MNHPYSTFVGIDISAKTFDVAVIEQANDAPTLWHIKQTQSGYAMLHKRLSKINTSPETVLVSIREIIGT